MYRTRLLFNVIILVDNNFEGLDKEKIANLPTKID